MGYAKNWWVPDDAGIGIVWREIFNRYFRDPITFETLSKILSDSGIKDSEISWRVSLAEAAYFLHHELGESIYVKLATKVKGSASKSLKSFYVNKDYNAYYRVPWDDLALMIFGCKIAESIFESVKNEKVYGIIRGVRKDLAANPFFTMEAKKRSVVGKQSEDPIINAFLSLENLKGDDIAFTFIMSGYKLLCDLVQLRSVALKTWGHEEEMHQLSVEEFNVIKDHYVGCVYALDAVESKEGIDPETITFSREGPLSNSLNGRGEEVFGKIMKDFVWDFADELLDHNRHEAIKGSGICIECSQAFQKSFYGRHQAYCSIQCKRRAAKRRQRAKEKRKSKLL